jgi:hypothetical protein
MQSKPSKNFGIVANTVTATTIAVGSHSSAVTHESSQASAAVARELHALIELLDGSDIALPVKEAATREVALAKECLAAGKPEETTSHMKSILEIFKSAGDAVGSAEKIASVALKALELMQ